MAMPESRAIMAMPRMSSMIRMPKISCAKCSLVLPSPARALTMIVVEEIESMAPRNKLSIVPQWNSRPIS